MDDLYPTDADLRQFYITSKKDTVFYSSGAPPSEAENFARKQDKRFYISELLAAGVFKQTVKK